MTASTVAVVVLLLLVVCGYFAHWRRSSKRYIGPWGSSDHGGPVGEDLAVQDVILTRTIVAKAANDLIAKFRPWAPRSS
jgi:hypothetical protein